MNISKVTNKDKEKFNQLALHPLQAWEWGEFRKKTGIEAIRLGKYEKEKLIETAQVTIHPLPFTPWTIGYFPKGKIPSREMLEALYETGKQHRCIFIKLEPNIKTEDFQQSTINNQQLTIKSSPHPLFTKYTFQLDLTKSEEELLKNMHPKTRYNIKVAQKHGVTVAEDNSKETFEDYLKLMFETTRRQKFYAHNKRYHQIMWETLRSPKSILQPRSGREVQSPKSNNLTAHLLVAKYCPPSSNKPIKLVAWILFLFNDILYYPYGASSDQYRQTMASNLMMWEAIRFGKKKGAKIFDMWGSLGPNPDSRDPWYGFHRFKQGYGGKLVEFVGSFDLIINPNLYSLYNLSYRLRQIFLTLCPYVFL